MITNKVPYAIVAIGCVLILLIGGVGVYFNREPTSTKALDSFRQGRLGEAQIELDHVAKALPLYRALVYQSYIDRAIGSLDASQNALEQAISLKTDKKIPQSILLEIELGIALNSYLTKDFSKMSQAVNRAKEIDPGNGWVQFFLGIVSFQSQDYSQALKTWSQASRRPPLSPWMSIAFSKIFDAQWEAIHFGQAEIETGNFITARQILMKSLKKIDENETEEQKRIQFLIGMTYILEADSKAMESALPYYKLAFSYFSKIEDKKESFLEYKNMVLDRLKIRINDLIAMNAFHEIPSYFSFYDLWGDAHEKESLGKRIIALLNYEKHQIDEAQRHNLIVLIDHIIKDETVRNKIAHRFFNQALEEIDQGNLEYVLNTLQYAKLFSKEIDSIDRQAFQALEQQVLKLIADESINPNEIAPYFSLLQSLMQDQKQLETFATSLVALVQETWDPEQDYSRMNEILILSLSYPKQEKTLVKHLKDALNSNYAEAILSDNHEAAEFLEHIAKELYLTDEAFKDKKVNQAHLTKAEQMLLEGEVQNAKERVAFVKSLDPQDAMTSKLEGLIAFYEGDYKTAASNLKNVQETSKQVKEALALSSVIESKDHNLQMEYEWEDLQDSQKLTIALGFLAEGDVEKTKEWLKRTDSSSNVHDVAYLVSAHLEGNWDQVIELYENLPYPYHSLDGITSAVIDSWISVGNIKKADEALKNLLDSPPEPLDSAFPPEFLPFKRKVLDQWDRHTIAGLYFKYIHKNSEEASNHFLQIENPSPQILLERAELEYRKQNFEQAEHDLLKVINQDNNQEARKEALPLLASLYTTQGAYYDAYPLYRTYFRLEPQEVFFRGDFARTLMQLRLFDLANEQYTFLNAKNLISESEQVQWIQTLIHLNQFETALRKGRSLLQAPETSLNTKLQLATALLPATHSPVFSLEEQKVLDQKTRLNEKEIISYLNLISDVGNYALARSVAEVYSDQIKYDPSALVTLARIYQEVGDFNQTKKLLHRVLKLQPGYFKAQQLLSQIENDPVQVKEYMKELRNRIDDKDPDFNTYIAYVKTTLHYISLIHPLDTLPRSTTLMELQNQENLLKQLKQQFPELPEIYFLLGETYKLRQSYDDALDAYSEAFKLDPSFDQALVEAGKINFSLNRIGDSLKLAQQAVHYVPNNSQAWLMIAKSHIAMGNIELAVGNLNQSLTYDPNNIDANLLLAQLYIDLVNPEQAIVHLEHILILAPQHQKALALLLQTLSNPLVEATARDQSELERARKKIYETLYQLNPEFAEKALEKESL
ncbi:MAG: hypothetical protein Tsb0021_10730 [Chlamydiales bacterium]